MTAFRRTGWGFREGRQLVPAAPSTGLLFDWDPEYSLESSRVGGIQFAGFGAPKREVQANGRVAAVFDGLSALMSQTSPFADLADLAGGCSLYVMCGVDNIPAGSSQAVEIFRNDGTTNQVATLNVGLSSSLVNVANFANSLGSSDSEPGLLASTPSLISGHFQTTATTARLNGAGFASAAGKSPAGMNQVIIGATATFTATPPRFGSVAWVGRIHRVLVYEGATYDAGILAYLQGLYT